METQATSQKQNALMTLVVVMTFVVSILAFLTYVTIHDVIPFVQHFADQLGNHSTT